MVFDDEDDLDQDQEQLSGQEADEQEDHEDDAAPEGQQEDGRRADAGEERHEEEGQVRRPSRSETRIQALRNENREYGEQIARMRREFEEFKQNAQRQQTQAPDPEVERRKLEMMTPEERMDYRLEQSEKRHDQQLRQMQFDSWNNTDRASFQAAAASNTLLAKHKDEVESVFHDEVNKGRSFDRMTIAAFVIGRATLTQGAKALKKAQDAGRRRIEGQRVVPNNPRGNVPAERRGGKSLEERLADVTF